MQQQQHGYDEQRGSVVRGIDPFLEQVQTIFDEEDFPAIVQAIGCTFGIYVGTRDPICNYHDIAAKTDPELRTVFFLKCIEKGLYFHTDFTVSAMHTEETLAQSLELLRDATRETKMSM